MKSTCDCRQFKAVKIVPIVIDQLIIDLDQFILRSFDIGAVKRKFQF